MFIANWFEQTGKNNFEKHLNRFIGETKLRFLEVGCFEGSATVWMLKNILTDNSSKIDVIDTFEGGVEHQNKKELKIETLKERFLDNTFCYREKININVGLSHKLLNTFEKNIFDFIYIDGSHQATDVIEDAILAFKLLKQNGVMAFDDYKWNNQGNPCNHPKIALDAFVSIFADKLQVIEKNYQLFIKKI
jgi:predicted O-methyltransferase YrrM